MKASVQLEDDYHEDPIRELGLALAVVEQALRDIQNMNRRRNYRAMRTSELNADQCAADDAREFLLVRLWEEGNVWGETLRLYGVQPFTKQRLVHGVRNLETTNERRRNQRWQKPAKAKSVDDEQPPLPVLRRCETCSTKAVLFVVRDKRICEQCGALEVKQWNQLVKEAG